MIHWILIYLFIMNLAGFILMGADKKKAIRHRYRIPEARLFIIAFLGGSLGSIIGMYFFRHKTKHTKFTVGMPAVFIIQIALFVFAFSLC